MGKIAGYKKRDRVWYDTSVDHPPGRGVRLFGNHNVGRMFLTNLQVGSTITYHGCESHVDAVGVRVPGATMEEEDRVLDHFVVVLTVARNNNYGPWHGSLLRCTRRFGDWVDLKRDLVVEEVRAEAEQRDCPVRVTDHDAAMVAADRLYEHGASVPDVVVPQQVGYRLREPVVVPHRTDVSVVVYADDALPEPTTLRVTLFGREVSTA